MKELYDILDDLYEVEANQQAFEFLLTLVEECYMFSEHKEIRFVVNSTKCYIKAINRELSAIIERMDEVLSKKGMD